MTFETEIRGMSFFRGPGAKNGVHRLALAEIYIPELGVTIKGVQLTWSPSKGFIAQSPSAMIYGSVYAIQWHHKSEFARDLAKKMVTMFERMGGELPDSEPTRRDHVTGKAIGPDPFEAAKAGEIERRVFPVTFSVEEHEDDDSGLRAMLGVDPSVAEACDHAGL